MSQPLSSLPTDLSTNFPVNSNNFIHVDTIVHPSSQVLDIQIYSQEKKQLFSDCIAYRPNVEWK
jgi:hypothetical protein